MKLALVFDGLRCGGIERVGLDYINIFINLGYEVTVYNLNPKLTEMENEICEECKIEHIVFPRWLAPERYAATLKKTWWGKYIYPLAYLFITWINVLYHVVLFIRKSSIRKKFDVSVAFSGHINDLTFITGNFVKSKHKVAWLHGALYGYAIISPGFLRLYSKIKNLVSLSDSCDAAFYRYLNEFNINKKTIYNPVFIQNRMIDDVFVEKLKKVYGDFCLMVARMEDDKDQKTAIDAIEILKNKYGLKKNLILVGDGKNRHSLEQYVIDKQMDDQVFFMGKRADVQNFYSSAAIYVHSSPLEGLPTVLLEAMNYHLPIASTDSIPGVTEILQNEKYGLVSNIFDFEGLADNIYKLYTDDKLSMKLINAGANRIKDFSPKEIEGKISAFFRTLL